MPKTLKASDRNAIIRLASTLPVGSPERRTLLVLSKNASSRVDRDEWGTVADGFEGMFSKATKDANKWAKRMWPQNAGVKLLKTSDFDHDNGDSQRYGYSANTTAKVELWVGRGNEVYEITLTEDTQPPELDELGVMEVDLDKNVIYAEWDDQMSGTPSSYKASKGWKSVQNSLTSDIEEVLINQILELDRDTRAR